MTRAERLAAIRERINERRIKRIVDGLSICPGEKGFGHKPALMLILGGSADVRWLLSQLALAEKVVEAARTQHEKHCGCEGVCEVGRTLAAYDADAGGD